MADIVDYGQQAIAALVTMEQRAAMEDWLHELAQGVLAAGGVAGTQAACVTQLTAHYSVQPFVFDGHPQRDERFTDPYNLGVKAEAFLYDERYPPMPRR